MKKGSGVPTVRILSHDEPSGALAITDYTFLGCPGAPLARAGGIDGRGSGARGREGLREGVAG